jgi:hypothetical protein
VWPGVLGGQPHGEGQVRDPIDEGDDVAADPVSDALEGVTGQHLQGPGRDLLGFSGLGVPRPRRSMRLRAWRILSGARAMMRPMVETLGSAMPCWAHQGASSTWSLALPRFGWRVRRRRISLTRRGSVLGVLRLVGAEDFAARAAGLPPWALSAAFQR